MFRAYLYHIRIQGHLPASWDDCFDQFAIHPLDNGETLLAGPVPDQAALRGLLIKILDLGLPLLALERKEPLS